MTFNTTSTKEVKEILNYSPRALETLHNLFGFDYCQPFEVVKYEGAFTINKLNTACGVKNYAVLVDSSFFICTKGLRLFEVVNGQVNIDFSLSLYDRGIDNFYRKSDFETARKMSDVAYIIWQNPKYKIAVHPETNCNGTPLARKNVLPLDFNERLLHLKKDYSYFHGYQNGVEYSFCSAISYRNRENKVFDNSGYRVDLKREELRRRANALKIDRDKIKANNANYDDAIKFRRNDLTELKNNITFRIQRTNDLDKLKALESAFSYTVKGFSELREFENHYILKEFTSVERIERFLGFVDGNIRKAREVMEVL